MAEPPVRVRCPKCHSRLDILDTHSGARIVSVALLGASVEQRALALETSHRAEDKITRCPACDGEFDPSEPYRALPPLKLGEA